MERILFMTANNPHTKRAKGQQFEREIAEDLRSSGLDKNARRMMMSGAMEDLKSDIITSLPIHFECKRQESWNVDKYYEQALSGKKQQEIAVVVMKKSRKEAMTLLSWKDFIWLLQLARESGQLNPQYGFTKRQQLNK